MTREEIIKGLYRGYGCTDKDECFESGCRACLDKMFNKYEQKIRADAIDEYKIALHTKYKENKDFAYSVWEGNIYKYDAMANLDLEEIDEIAERLKE